MLVSGTVLGRLYIKVLAQDSPNLKSVLNCLIWAFQIYLQYYFFFSPMLCSGKVACVMFAVLLILSFLVIGIVTGVNCKSDS